MRPKTRQLLLDIARCQIIPDHLAGKCTGCRCQKIIETQRDENGQVLRNLARRQIPEPWSGDIETARLMFVSSNPSISDETDSTQRENYPDATWTDDQIVAFFSRRWEDGWAANGRHRTIAGTYWPRQGVKYWTETHHTAQEIYAVDPTAADIYDVTQLQPGHHYVLTEVVHCKSKNNKGVPRALPRCSERYFLRILDVAAAPVVLIVGRISWGLMRPMMQGALEARELEHVQYYRTRRFGRERHFLFVEAPSGPFPRRLPALLAEEMDILQRLHDVVTAPPEDQHETSPQTSV